MKKGYVLFAFIVVFSFAAIACSTPQENSNPTSVEELTTEPVPTSTPEPTATPEPVETPVPTATPKPTPTPEPTVTPVPTFNTDWASNDMEKLIPEPPMVIARSYDDGGVWIITNRLKDFRLADEPRFEVTADVTRVQALEYFDTLRGYGFIETSPVYENKTNIEDAIGGFFLTPDEKYSVTIWHKDDYNMSISIKLKAE